MDQIVSAQPQINSSQFSSFMSGIGRPFVVGMQGARGRALCGVVMCHLANRVGSAVSILSGLTVVRSTGYEQNLQHALLFSGTPKATMSGLGPDMSAVLRRPRANR